MLGGLHRSDLVVLAGRPSMGKTALATNIGFNAAQNGETVGFFSLEMANEQLGARVLGGESRIPADWVRRGDLNQQHFNQLIEAKRRTDGLPLWIDDTPALTVAGLRTRARRLKRRHGLDLVVIDYLQLLRPARKDRIQGGQREQNRVQEVSEITRDLKGLAKELDLPVLALSQLNRSVEQRDDKRPLLSDLRESGSIEQDADVVIFVYREEYYLREPPVEDAVKWTQWRDKLNAVHDKAELIVAKHRHGQTGSVRLHFDRDATRFSNLAIT
jgi:replicative DNA helicase